MKRETITVRIDSLAFEGKGVARVDGKVLFVRGAVPGDLVEVAITKEKKNYSEGKLVRVVEPSAKRIEPRCEHFGVCGGCSFQNIHYEEQIKWKHKFVSDAFEKIAKLNGFEIKPAIPSVEIFEYRNKMEFSFGTSRWLTEEEIQKGEQIESASKHFALGFHIPERFDKVIDINRCLLQEERGNILINEIRAKTRELGVPAYNLRTHLGFLRNVVIRYSKYSGELLLNLVTTSQIGEKEKEFLQWYREYFLNLDFVHHLVHTINNRFSPVAYGEYEILKGSGYLTEELHGVKYRISPFSFFQVNTKQAEVLVEKVVEFADAKGKVVWDLYSGAGTFSLSLAQEARLLVGIEAIESAVADARVNADVNNIKNVEFLAKDLHSKSISKKLQELPKPDVIVVDPPRTGIHKNLLNALLEIMPDRIIYVSCNPTTQARDCSLMSEKYQIVEIQPVDMFPHTYHIESIALLVRKR
jgi:23S rRNA (uracil1939-C5)-methyltransferase